MPTVLRGIVKWSRPIYDTPYFGQDHLTGAEGMFGLRGFTVIVPAEGEIIRSISTSARTVKGLRSGLLGFDNSMTASTIPTAASSLVRVRFSKGGRMVLNLAHGLPVVDFLAANRTLVELQRWNRVALALELAGPVTAYLLDLVAATSRAGGDL